MDNDGIVGIENRTENWKTAYYFALFFRDDSARLRLTTSLGAPKSNTSNDIQIELFWKGMRDYFHQNEEPTRNNAKLIEDLAELYVCLFPDLRKRIEEFSQPGNELRLPQKWNYNPNHVEDTLASNLINTEIDIAIETPTHLFIGEAKEESGFDGDGQYVLVHQLIRQYVMAWVLISLQGKNKKVVPFVVGGNKNQNQVKFMKKQGWLDKKNVLSWKCVKAIAEGKETCHG